MSIITVRCPSVDNQPGPHGPITGCGRTFDVETDGCDDMIDCACGLFFNPCHCNSQPQSEEARAGWAQHMTRYESDIRTRRTAHD